LLAVDLAAPPRGRRYAGVGRELASVLIVAKQTLRPEDGGELGAYALQRTSPTKPIGAKLGAFNGSFGIQVGFIASLREVRPVRRFPPRLAARCDETPRS
jgi:hypothetical protein